MLTDKGDLFIVQHALMEEVAIAASLGACTKGGLEGSKELLGWHRFRMVYLLRGDHKPLSNSLPLHIGGFRRLSIILYILWVRTSVENTMQFCTIYKLGQYCTSYESFLQSMFVSIYTLL